MIDIYIHEIEFYFKSKINCIVKPLLYRHSVINLFLRVYIECTILSIVEFKTLNYMIFCNWRFYYFILILLLYILIFRGRYSPPRRSYRSYSRSLSRSRSPVYRDRKSCSRSYSKGKY